MCERQIVIAVSSRTNGASAVRTDALERVALWRLALSRPLLYTTGRRVVRIRHRRTEPTTRGHTSMTLSAVCAATVCFSRSRYTGRERDSESGNDYFEARYYRSAMGRFMSPDWAAKVEPVPYSKLDNPQTLNLYAYVGNNPLIRADAERQRPSFAISLRKDTQPR